MARGRFHAGRSGDTRSGNRGAKGAAAVGLVIAVVAAVLVVPSGFETPRSTAGATGGGACGPAGSVSLTGTFSGEFSGPGGSGPAGGEWNASWIQDDSGTITSGTLGTGFGDSDLTGATCTALPTPVGPTIAIFAAQSFTVTPNATKSWPVQDDGSWSANWVNGVGGGGSASGTYTGSGTLVPNGVVGVCLITQLLGTVTITHSDGTVTPAAVYSPVATGDTITTSPDGSAQLLCADGTGITMAQDSKLPIDQWTFDQPSQQGSSTFGALQGLFQFVSGLIGHEGHENIDTPHGELGIRGTEFILQVDPDHGSTIVNLHRGDVDFTPVLSGVTTAMHGPETASFDSSSLLATAPLTDDEYTLLLGQLALGSSASGPTQITSDATTTFTEGSTGSFRASSTGTLAAALSESGPLPSGLRFVDNGDGTATLSGTPDVGTAGTYPVSITATNGFTPSATQAFTLTVAAAPPSGGTLTLSQSVGPASLGHPYAAHFTASGGTAPYHWTKTGPLPKGLKLNASTGVVSGTPVRAETANFTIKVKDASKHTASAAASITVTAPALAITTPLVPGAALGHLYTAGLVGTGGTAPYHWKKSGSLPKGLKLNASTGVIAGTPTRGGTATFRVIVQDKSKPKRTATKTFSITVS